MSKLEIENSQKFLCESGNLFLFTPYGSPMVITLTNRPTASGHFQGAGDVLFCLFLRCWMCWIEHSLKNYLLLKTDNFLVLFSKV